VPTPPARKRVVVTGTSFPPDVATALRAHGLDVDVIPGDLGADSVATALDGAWGYILGGSERMPSEAWARLPELRAVSVMATGYRMFIQLPGSPSSIRFTYTPHANANAVAEFTVALALDRLRRVTELGAEVAAGRWSEAVTGSLIGARVGVAGMGHIGRAVSGMVTRSFGAEVAYWNRTARPELAGAGYTRAASLADLCERVDVLVLAMAYAPGENDGIVGGAELAALGQHGVLVNAAAPGLVDPAALRKALETDRISAAAFDGYYQEPVPSPEDDPYGLLRLHPRLLVTPHCASLTRQAIQRMAEMAAANLLAVLHGGDPPNAIPAAVVVTGHADGSGSPT